MHLDEMSLRDYVSVVSGRRWLVAVAIVTCVLVGTVLSASQTSVYEASSEVLIQPRGQDGLFDDERSTLNSRAIETEIQVMEGQAVADRVQRNLDLDDEPPTVDAEAVGDADVVALRVRDPNAQNAATLANAYAEAYIEVRREQSVAELLAASAEVQLAIDDLQRQIESLPDDDPRRQTLVAQQGNFRTTLDQLRVDAALRTGGASIIKAAEVPDSPVEPTVFRTAALALVVGLLIGVGAAILAHHLDDKIRTDDDLERIGGLPLLAHVPVDPPADNRPLALSSPEHSSVEAYRGLRTNIQFLALDRSMKLVQITSSLAAEGKTTTATNLAVVLAQAGNRVAMVDADLRRPRIHEVFGISSTPGLTDLLLGEPPQRVRVPLDIEGGSLDVYPSGDVPANPSELLSGDRIRGLLRRMAEHYDYVIVDSAPILPVSDSVALAASVNGVVLVAQAGRATAGNVEGSLERLQQVSAPMLGFVLNRATGKANEVYAYGYGYGPAQKRARGEEPAPV